MLLLGKSTGPITSMPASLKKAMEILTKNPYPDYIKRDYYYTFGGDGVNFYVIFNIEEGHEAEGVDNILSRMAELGSASEGAAGTLEPIFTIENAFAWWGGQES